MLLYPEGMVKLNNSAAAIMTRCDGVRTVADIVADIERTYEVTGLAGDVGAFVVMARDERVVGVAGVSELMAAIGRASRRWLRRPGPPLWLLMELTYRCPLHCVFCYNPTDFATTGPELATQDWIRVLHEARALGAVQLGLSGGEPLARDDLEVIVAEAHSLGFYSNLITSGIGMTEARIAALKEAGLDHIQLSFQDSSREMNDFLSSTRTFELKSKVAALIRKYEYPMVLNCVLHRLNIDHVEEILELAERMGAEYVELANTQYYGWAWLNRAQLMPTREQLRKAEEDPGAVPRAARAEDENLLRRARLFRDPSEGLYERTGVGVSDSDAGRDRSAVSRRAHVAGADFSERALRIASRASGTTRRRSIIFAATIG